MSSTPTFTVQQWLLTAWPRPSTRYPEEFYIPCYSPSASLRLMSGVINNDIANSMNIGRVETVWRSCGDRVEVGQSEWRMRLPPHNFFGYWLVRAAGTRQSREVRL